MSRVVLVFESRLEAKSLTLTGVASLIKMTGNVPVDVATSSICFHVYGESLRMAYSTSMYLR